MLTDLQYQQLEQAIACAIRDGLDSPERRRFDAAKAAMTAILSRHAEPGFTREGAATEAVLQADALLEALEADRE